MNFEAYVDEAILMTKTVLFVSWINTYTVWVGVPRGERLEIQYRPMPSPLTQTRPLAMVLMSMMTGSLPGGASKYLCSVEVLYSVLHLF